jgi:hypothetical protein
MEGSVLGLQRQGLSLLAVAVFGMLLSGCAGGSGRVPVGFTGDGDCHSVKAELRQLDAQGVPGMIQSQSGGAHVSGASKSKIDRYNFLLEEYLGNDCQLPPST